MKSCIFEGRVRHTRRWPVAHRFRYRVFMMYLDLAELDTVFRGRWFWSTHRWALARFRRRDHLGSANEPLDQSVRRLVARRTGSEPAGPVRLLTNLSYFGYCFNPVSFYYCYASDGETLEAVVAEVNNTPWNEQYCYVLPKALNVGRKAAWRFKLEKKMHVSPFIGMDVDYDWTFTWPGDRLTVFMAVSRARQRFFDASMNMCRTEISGWALARVLLVYPFMTLKVIAAIHWQALKLWWKGCPVFPHPRKRARRLQEQK